MHVKKHDEKIKSNIETAWLHASSLFGSKFLVWVLNIKQSSSLNETQQEGLTLFHEYYQKVTREKISRYEVLNQLMQPVNDHLTIINYLRTSCGGTLPCLQHYELSDQNSVAELALRYSPLLFLVNTDIVNEPIFQNSAINNNRYGYIERILTFSSFKDPVIKYAEWPSLKKLKRLVNEDLPNNDEWWHASVIMTVKYAGGASGGSFQLYQLDEMIIREALKNIPKSKSTSLTYFIDKAVSVYSDFILVLKNERANRKVKVIFSGARIEDDHAGKINGSQWKFHKTKYEEVEGVLPPQRIELTMPQEVEIKFSATDEDFLPKTNEMLLYENLSELDLVRFAASFVNPQINLEFVSLETISVPFSNSSSRSWREPISKSYEDIVLTKEDCKKILSFVRKLYQVHESAKLMLPIRRYLMSDQQTRRADDALIDLVIVLEALFVQGEQGELSNRIASSVAFLLEPEKKRRRKVLYDLVKKSYAVRSKLVHGSVGKLKYEQVLELKKSLKEVVMRCFKELIFGDKKLHEPNLRWDHLVMLRD